MFGEFTDEQQPPAPCPVQLTPSTVSAPPPCVVEAVKVEGESQCQRIARHLAAVPDLMLKSQQRGEPDLTTQEKVDLALQLMEASPSQFLFRFGSHLRLEHLDCFTEKAEEDLTTAHYLQEARNKLDHKKTNVLVRNRRWAAVERLRSSDEGGAGQCSAEMKDYFTEAEMKRRNPLLYEQLIGQHLTEDEKKQQQADYDRADCRFTTILFDHMDKCNERSLKEEQEEEEDDMFEEEEDEDSEEEEEAMEQEENISEIDPVQKALLREEFVSSMYNTFVDGKDTTFDYRCIDDNEEYDLLDVEGHDQEEKYFDDEEPREASLDSPVTPQLCLDRRLKDDLSEESAVAEPREDHTNSSKATLNTDVDEMEVMPPVESLSIR